MANFNWCKSSVCKTASAVQNYAEQCQRGSLDHIPTSILANGPAYQTESSFCWLHNADPREVMTKLHCLMSPVSVDFLLVAVTKAQHFVQSVRCHASSIVHEDLHQHTRVRLKTQASTFKGEAERMLTRQSIPSKFCMSMQNLQAHCLLRICLWPLILHSATLCTYCWALTSGSMALSRSSAMAPKGHRCDVEFELRNLGWILLCLTCV